MKRVLLFSLLFTLKLISGQVIIRNSDYKKFDSVEILGKNGEKKILNKNNIKNFDLPSSDKVIFESKTYDFTIYSDTLVFFDKVKEIEQVALSGFKAEGENKTFRSSKKRASAEVFKNGYSATYVNLNTDKTTFIKSFIVFPQRSLIFNGKFDGILQIKIVKNLNGFPDSKAELISFEKNLSEIKVDKYGNAKGWEIFLPKIIKYSSEGFFIVLNLKPLENSDLAFTLNNDSQMYMYYPKEGWKKMSYNGYRYNLKVLQ